VKIVINGAGASAISCTRLYCALGAQKANIFMFDSKGLLHPARTNLDGKKSEFVNDRLAADAALADALAGADVFVGLSKGNILDGEMVKSMAPDCIVFAMANPTPEISYDEATAARQDIIMATGRSDYPNQVNNVLGFPFIFRGALDVRATAINEEMKLAAVRALAGLAKKPVPDIVNLAYNNANLVYGRDYIIPKPVDPRLLTTVAPAVARAAMESGVAQNPVSDWGAYEIQLSKRLGIDNNLTRVIQTKAKQKPKRVVFADAENVAVLKAVQVVVEENIAQPILLGNVEKVRNIINEHSIVLYGVPVIDPKNPATPEELERMDRYAKILYEKRQRKGFIYTETRQIIKHRNYFGAMMVETGEVDAMISGLSRNYPDTIRPALRVIGPKPGIQRVSGMYILMSRFGPLFLADTSVNPDPTAEEVVEIAELAAIQVEKFNIKPRIAMLTYSSFGSVATGTAAVKMRTATAILQAKHPEWIVDGEMQAHLAFDTELLRQNYPFSTLANGGPANTLIFPNLSSANIAYNLVRAVAGIEIIGPIIMGLKKPVHVLQLGSSVREIVDMVAIAVVDAQRG
jgi:malate dehydrogenase (oxaloacetate-decarboxylating)(NADP+)